MSLKRTVEWHLSQCPWDSYYFVLMGDYGSVSHPETGAAPPWLVWYDLALPFPTGI